MELEVHWVNHRLVEVKTDEVKTGILNREESIELAKNLISVANELLSVELDK